MSISEFHQLRILSPAWEGYSLQFQCPLVWTFNQIKCYITYISPRLQFHQFEITFAGRVLPGSQHLQQLVDEKREKDRTVLFLSSKPAEKFEQYYADRMKKFLEVVEQEMTEMHPPDPDRELEGVPVLCSNFNATMNRIAMPAGPHLDNLPHANNAAQPPRANADADDDGEGPHIGGIIDRAIVIGVLWLSWLQGSYLQIFCICVLLGLHEFVTRRRRDNREQQRPPQSEAPAQPTSKQARALKRLWWRVREFTYCYFMSLFPNWNVQKDYLEKFQNEIVQIKLETQDTPARNAEKPAAAEEAPADQPQPQPA